MKKAKVEKGQKRASMEGKGKLFPQGGKMIPLKRAPERDARGGKPLPEEHGRAFDDLVERHPGTF